MLTVDHRLVEIALERANSTDFEKFVQAFYSAIFEKNYVPMGGHHDGGADGWFPEGLFGQGSEESEVFLQASITESTETKIRKTLHRLREVGRNPKAVYYCTSRSVSKIDILENDLSDELNCRIIIRDGQYLINQINSTAQTVQAFNSYLAPALSFLKSAGTATLIEASDKLPARTLCVFVGQELERRRGQSQLLEAVADSLILWSLEGTDPDKGIFKSRDEIETIVLEALPSARVYFKGVLDLRLNELRSKTSNSGRQINFHKSVPGYCLPYETRKLIEEENIEDEKLKLEVSKIFRERARIHFLENAKQDALIDKTIDVCHSSIQKLFLDQGLEISIYVTSDDTDDQELPSAENHIDDSIKERGLKGDDAARIASTALSVLRQTFYSSTEIERKYLGKLSRTYILMFLLKNEPRIVEYLRTMSSNFKLYVGTDIIVRCLSEHMLSSKDKMMKNALSLLKAAGSSLILTDKTLDEVWHHLRTSDVEYRIHYRELTQYMTADLVKQIDKILVRAYFYSRFDSQDKNRIPLSWNNYISQFCSYEWLTSERARDELREYLVNEYSFDFESNQTLENSIDTQEWDELAEQIYKSRVSRFDREEESERILSRNAAATILRVYSRRQMDNERPGSNPYGNQTWWMTQQKRVRGATGRLVALRRVKYMMPPEFVIHMLGNIPTKADIQKSYEAIFPSILGVKLGNRMEDKAFKEVIDEAKKVYQYDESRARVMLAQTSSDLQSDFLKRYT